MPKPAMVTGLLLVVAVFAFVGLAFQTVPLSTTQTITRESTERGASYSPYLVIDTPTYATKSVSLITLTSTGGEVGCLYDQYGCTPWYTSVYYSSITFTNTLQTTYETSTTAPIPYSQTVTSSVTESSIGIVPASTALGLTDGAFTTLAVTVIGILVFFTAWVALKPRMASRPKRATFSGASLADFLGLSDPFGTVPAPQPETPKTTPPPGEDRTTFDRKEFEDFLAENQKLLNRSQALMNSVDQLENENKQLRDELQTAKARLESIKSNLANNTPQTDDLRKALETISRLAEEADKRTSK